MTRSEYLDDHDRLTGLLARKAALPELDRRLAEARAAARPLAILMLDVDHLKRVNDVHSLGSGDKALRVVATVLTEAWTNDVLPCRYGGEEFLVVLDGQDEAAARRTAEALRAAVERRVYPDYWTGTPHAVTVSIGVAGTWQSCDATQHDLLRTAEDAVQLAKLAGRNCIR